MKIEKGSAHTSYHYWTVLVNPGELVVDSVSDLRLRYSTWIGVIRESGKIDVWTPAASVPRGYRAAAKEMLEEAREKLRREGKVR